MPDLQRLEQTLDRWNAIRHENYSEKPLVSYRDWESWLSFEKNLNRTLFDLIQNATIPLTPETLQTLDEIDQKFLDAHHVPREELEENLYLQEKKLSLLKKLHQKFV